MTNQPPIHVNVQTGAGEVIRIAATLLMFGGAGALAWAVAQNGYAELAGTGLTVMTVQVVKMMWISGLIGLPAKSSTSSESEDSDIKSIRSFAAANYRVLMKYQADSPAPRMVAIGFMYAVAFLILRAGMVNALSIFQNMIIAGGAAAILGSIVVMPKLLPNVIGTLKAKGVVRVAQPTTPVAAPQPPTAPVPAPTPTVKRVVVRKKNTEGGTHA
ncbi:hypothetical protein [Rhodococcus qingshengii]|uniref:hypothetical protein n=1 Tax=Rhodococcus qingshengii TaxID=334542 RepID=UPI001E46C22D|nr:hypothetical protein [Rhodococcus qingshengii]UDF21567.1 hypothetical protein LE551_01395 [Rhodococcus qingshengii]